MATVSSDERRMLRDYFGYSDVQIDGLSDTTVEKHLAAYYAQQETGFYSKEGTYDGPSPSEVLESSDWITQGVLASGREAAEGLAAAGEAILTTASQVGTGLAEGAETTAKLSKILIPAALVLAGFLAYVYVKGL